MVGSIAPSENTQKQRPKAVIRHAGVPNMALVRKIPNSLAFLNVEEIGQLCIDDRQRALGGKYVIL